MEGARLVRLGSPGLGELSVGMGLYNLDLHICSRYTYNNHRNINKIKMSDPLIQILEEYYFLQIFVLVCWCNKKK
jgi:hypothetical protein